MVGVLLEGIESSPKDKNRRPDEGHSVVLSV